MKIENSNIKNKQITFKSKEDVLFKTLNATLKPLDSFIKMQENLSSTRFIQDTATNWAPKAVFARSKADLAEMSFLEFLESGLFYFAPGIVGEKLLRRKVFAKSFDKDLIENASKSVGNILKDENLVKSGAAKKLIPLKAGILLGCVCVPAAEYALSFAKNLFTLKVFKTTNFDKIANLDKNINQAEDKEKQEKVRKSAYKNIAKAGIIAASGLGLGIFVAKTGHKSEAIQKFSKILLEPGTAIAEKIEKSGKKAPRLSSFLKNYLNLDFDGEKGKLALSKGQLAVTAISGFFGYNHAAKDRSRLDQLEVLTRVPLVVFYTIFGSSLFESGFKSILHKNGIFSDLITKGSDNSLKVPLREELPEIAKKLATKNKTNIEDEFKKLIKGKATITAVPFLFSLFFMGFTLSAVSRFWTQYRYNVQNNKTKTASNFIKETPEVFSKFS